VDRYTGLVRFAIRAGLIPPGDSWRIDVMSQDPASRSLSIVIPALNEEQAIGRTLQSCLDARDEICQTAGIESVEVIAVSDGSTDRTAEIARGFDDVKVIVFAHNRGYGAAIKEGFRQGLGDWVGFLDADGTCDPRYFGEMCKIAREQGADIVLGSRLGPDSEMPWLRRVGNRLFAVVLGLLCGKFVTDIASGMRVMRRSALDLLYPLPDGLHFTPAMSARALLNGLRVVELPMRYRERVGASKLRVVQDGVRFFRVIIEGVLCYRPERVFLSLFAFCLFLGLLLSLYPIEFYFRHGRLEEWMLYRFLACFLLGAIGFQSVCSAALANRMASLGPDRLEAEGFWAALFGNVFSGRLLASITILAVVASVLLVWPGIVEYVVSGHVTVHWSRVVLAAFGMLMATQAVVTGVLLKVLDIWKVQSRLRMVGSEGRRNRA